MNSTQTYRVILASIVCGCGMALVTEGHIGIGAGVMGLGVVLFFKEARWRQ